MVLGILHKLIVGPPFPAFPQICVMCQEPAAANLVKTRCQHVFDRFCFQAMLQTESPSCPTCLSNLVEIADGEETDRGCFFCLNRVYSLFIRVLRG